LLHPARHYFSFIGGHYNGSVDLAQFPGSVEHWDVFSEHWGEFIDYCKSLASSGGSGRYWKNFFGSLGHWRSPTGFAKHRAGSDAPDEHLGSYDKHLAGFVGSGMHLAGFFADLIWFVDHLARFGREVILDPSLEHSCWSIEA
jgi:hypothetical protein